MPVRILWENFRFRTPERVGQCDVEVLLEVDKADEVLIRIRGLEEKVLLKADKADEVLIRIRSLENPEDAPHVAHYVHRDILQQFGLEKKRQTWVYEGLTSGSGV